MSNFVDLFKSFLYGYFEEKNDAREKNIIEKRFGLTTTKIYTLDELGILHKGISRERIRQIEDKAIKNLRTLIDEKRIKKINFSCDSLLSSEFKRFYNIIFENEVILMHDFITFTNCKVDDIRYLNLILKVMDVNIIPSPNHSCNVIISPILNKTILEKEIQSTYKILRKHVAYISIDDLLIETKKKRRTFDQNYILLALKCIKLETLTIDGTSLVGVYLDQSFSAGDIGYRILAKYRHPMSISDIYIEFNKLIHHNKLNISKSIRNLTNQMAQHDKIINIGAKQWALKEWNHDKKFIKETIKEAFHSKGVALTKEDVISFVGQTMPHIKSQTIVSYLSYDDFLKIKGNSFILKPGFSASHDEAGIDTFSAS
ncbi:sigma factor-like helix-turn-helix DNA-binding protein [Fusibacter sp. 3D3]|uniref:sigma factor-like helix-turn-helix DNA-binding protein n=1 Tax=Fusibacter sp. 3D3 TaxID=1048380 RepID=UPI0008537614|nr:sigma factor-like helix-turn-helix DNA-binding protein [Fusibacter sp. 3D3]GAU79060.1 hypothetical protein F3D3_3696 [Fusibacter sp. 3D3]